MALILVLLAIVLWFSTIPLYFADAVLGDHFLRPIIYFERFINYIYHPCTVWSSHIIEDLHDSYT